MRGKGGTGPVFRSLFFTTRLASALGFVLCGHLCTIEAPVEPDFFRRVTDATGLPHLAFRDLLDPINPSVALGIIGFGFALHRPAALADAVQRFVLAGLTKQASRPRNDPCRLRPADRIRLRDHVYR